ncbi:MAG: Rossmann-like and DUF2520 domain-containing protein [Hyphomicrobiales bacterium]
METKIGLVGSGNVASHLASSFYEKGIKVIQVWSREYENSKTLAEKIGAEPIRDINSFQNDLDIIIVSVIDDAIKDIATQLADHSAIIAHTSGTTSIDILTVLGDNYGVFYPLNTFSKYAEVDMQNTPFFIEADNDRAKETLKALATQISSKVIDADSKMRRALHIAAVFSCNFNNYLYQVAANILEENKLSFDHIKPLIFQTASKVMTDDPRKVQTGPAAREDYNTINIHLDELENHPDYRNLYKILTEQIIKDK